MLGSGRIDAPLLVLLGLFLLQGGFVVDLHLQCGLIALEEVLAIIAVHTHTLFCTRERCTFGRHPGLESERRFGQVYATRTPHARPTHATTGSRLQSECGWSSTHRG